MGDANRETTPRQRFADEIARRAGPLDARIRRALTAVDRADFVDGFFQPGAAGWTWITADSRPLPAATAELIYGDGPLVTAIDPRGRPRSSSTQPSLVAAMLQWLRLEPGRRVLEIGTGTGYNAALLAWIVGERGRVHTLDIDPEFVARAAPRIRAATTRPGCAPTRVSCADGAGGWPASAPYDRIIATAGCGAVPDAWWDQLDDDGLVLIPLSHGVMFPLAVLRKGARRGVWHGGWAGHAGFMLAVGDGLVRADDHAPVRVPAAGPVVVEDLDLEPAQVADLLFFLHFELPQVRMLHLDGDDAVVGPGLLDADTGGASVISGRRLHSAAHPTGRARMRDVVDRWRELGRPGLDRYRLRLGVDPATPPGALRSFTGVRGRVPQAVHLLPGA